MTREERYRLLLAGISVAVIFLAMWALITHVTT